jgi:hypothetical protein
MAGRIRNLAGALYRALTGGRTEKSEGRNTQEKAAALVSKHGSTKEAAKAAGVSQRTMQKWVKGTQQAKNTARGRNADKLAVAERQARMTKAGTKRVAASTGKQAGSGEGLRIKAVIQVSNDRRERTIRPGETLSAGAMESVIEKFINEGPDAAAQELQDLLNVYYFHGGRGSIEEITDIGF